MAKIQNLSELSQSFSFTEYDFFDFYRRSFERSELGRIKKLLWECCEKAYKTMCETSSRLGIRRPRTKYLDVEKANLGYAKQRKHSKSQTRSLTRRLLQLLGKLLKEIRKMEREHADAGVLTDKEKDFVRQELAKVRATTMEGSFGTQKEHYSLRRVKARKKETEILYIFFGIHTANAVLLAERLLEGQQAEAA